VHHELRWHASHAQGLPQGAVAFGVHGENIDVGVLAGDARQVIQAHLAGRAIGRVQHHQAAFARPGEEVLVGAGLLAFAEVLGEGGGILEFPDRVHVVSPVE